MNSENKKYRILLTGGGSGGSVSPLLAVAEELKIGSNFEFLWLGTKFGPEREMVESAGIKFKTIQAGKFRRYFSLKNLFDVFKIKIAFWQALLIMLKWRPDLAMSAGSFASAPAIWAAWISRIPVLIHQQDIRAGLANKLMAPFSKIITVVFESSLKDYGKKAVWIGNPVRQSVALATRNSQLATQFGLNGNLPVLLVAGGGTGAADINKLIDGSLVELLKFCRIIHVTGKNKFDIGCGLRVDGYERYEFLNVEQMAQSLNDADLVVTRAGIGMLSELSHLGKPCVIIPMPDSHQEENAEFFKNKNAAVVLDQKNLAPENFTRLIKNLLADEKALGLMANNMKNAMKRGARENMANIIKNICFAI